MRHSFLEVAGTGILEEADDPALHNIETVSCSIQHELVIVIIKIHGECNTHLTEIAGAISGISFLPRLTQHRQQHRGQNRNDGDHDEQFN